MPGVSSGRCSCRDGLVTESELETALAQQRLSNTRRLGEILVAARRRLPRTGRPRTRGTARVAVHGPAEHELDLAARRRLRPSSARHHRCSRSRPPRRVAPRRDRGSGERGLCPTSCGTLSVRSSSPCNTLRWTSHRVRSRPARRAAAGPILGGRSGARGRQGAGHDSRAPIQWPAFPGSSSVGAGGRGGRSREPGGGRPGVRGRVEGDPEAEEPESEVDRRGRRGGIEPHYFDLRDRGRGASRPRCDEDRAEAETDIDVASSEADGAETSGRVAGRGPSRWRSSQ